MKKQILLPASFLLASAIGLSAANTIDLNGTTYNIDTIFHAKVGPGTTQTHLTLQSPTSKLQVFYLTVDKTTPGVTMRSVCATDKVAGNETTSTMAKRKSGNGLLYFAGTNGDFYSTSGRASNGNSIIGTPTGANIVDGEVYRSINNNEETKTQQFLVDTSGMAYVGHMDTYKGIATIGGKTARFRGVNVNSRSDAITLYTSRFYGVTNQGASYADQCAEVTAKLVEGEKFQAGGKFKLEVTSTANSTGETIIPADGFVIHGRGTNATGANTSAIDFVNALQPGDIVEFDNYTTINGTQVYPYTVISGNPKILGGGEVLDTEANRSDASTNHPRTGIGHSVTGDSIIMMVVDGRTTFSAGVRTSVLGSIMKYAKAYEAVNIDGGGSSTLYTSGLGIRNNCSDGNERSVGNAIFAVVEAPEDNEIAEIQFKDWVLTSPKYGMYTPVIYGYNKYGVMVSDNVQGFTLSCPAELGEIVKDGTTLFGNGGGTYALTATYNGATASIPVTIDTENSPELKYSDVLIDNFRKWTVEVRSLVKEEYMSVNAEALSWASSDETVASISETGEITGIRDGSTIITGTVGDFTGNVNLKVECPTANVMPFETAFDPSTWEVSSKSSVKTFELAQGENSLKVNLAISSTRNPYITVSKELALWSLPDKIRIRINSGNTTFSKIIFKINAKGAQSKTITYPDSTLVEGENTFEIPVSEIGDINDIGIYPITFSSVQAYIKGSTGTDYNFEITALEAIYDNIPAGVETIEADTNTHEISLTPCPVTSGEPVTAHVKTDSETSFAIHSLSGSIISNGSAIPASGHISIPTANLPAGVYVVTVTQDGDSASARLIVK